MSPPLSPQPDDTRTALLQRAAELILGEINLLTQQQWEELPDLKRRKVVLARQLRQLDWLADTANRPEMNAAARVLAELEARAHSQMRGVMDLTAQRIVALQELQLYCRECDSVSLRDSASGAGHR